MNFLFWLWTLNKLESIRRSQLTPIERDAEDKAHNEESTIGEYVGGGLVILVAIGVIMVLYTA